VGSETTGGRRAAGARGTSGGHVPSGGFVAAGGHVEAGGHVKPGGHGVSGGRERLLVATRSAHKLRELRELLGPLRAALVDLDDVGIPDEAIEDGETFEANASLKARFFAALSGLPTLADDSGLEVDALNGGPGVRTRRYAGEQATDEENNVKLLGALAGLTPDRRGARYR
jgi:XTP/dITP diphosphohydrolase